MYILAYDMPFPAPDTADENGLLAIGGNLSRERLLDAYRNGIFPWYNEDDPVCWWSPDPRFVLFPAQLHISKTMKQVINSNNFGFTMNMAFDQVIRLCSTVKRKDTNGTWIHEEMIGAYSDLHNAGYAISAEAWHGNELVGGLYGIRMGRLFFGESMFSTMTNASKFAFIMLVESLKKEGLLLVDCQVYTAHLESLGAVMIPRKRFLEILKEHIG